MENCQDWPKCKWTAQLLIVFWIQEVMKMLNNKRRQRIVSTNQSVLRWVQTEFVL